MLIETYNSPNHSIYCLWALLIDLYINEIIKSWDSIESMYKVFTKYKRIDIGIVKFLYVLDWLFLLGIVKEEKSHIIFNSINR
jgi:hypothetical protein